MKSFSIMTAIVSIGLFFTVGACDDAHARKSEQGATAVQTNIAAVKDTFWIDVRTPEEFASGHLPEAYNIPLQEFEHEFASKVPDKNAIIALSCRSGNRSGKALAMAQAMGYTHAFNAGGYEALRQARSK